MSRPHSLTEGNILTSLMGFALPVLAALFLQTMYGAVDMMIVGQFSHAAEVSAVSTGSWIMQTITTAIVGLAMGTTILLGRKIGEGQPEEAGRVMGASIWIFAVIGLAVTAVMQFLAVPCTAWMRAPKEAFDSTAVYVKICSAGSLFIVAYNLLGSIFRGLGNSRLPLISVSIACLVNIAGDLLLVGVFHMASAGAAIATVFAQAVSVVLSILIIRKQKLPFAFRKESVRYDRQLAGRVVKLGFPIAFQDVLVSISFLVISAIVNTLGVIPSAGVGVAENSVVLCCWCHLPTGRPCRPLWPRISAPGDRNGPNGPLHMVYSLLWEWACSWRIFHFSTEICWLVCSPGTGRWCWRRQIICGPMPLTVCWYPSCSA